MTEKLDMVLFGATGVTGKHTIPMIAKFSKNQNRNLSWGIAGRSEEKLRKVLEDCQKETQLCLKNVAIIKADVENEDSLKKMAQKARIIINCCGPFRFYGEPVVKACAEEGTHHVDVSAEIQYTELMQLKYNKTAQEKGVYIVSACGFESIPVDLGTVYMQQNFKGTLNSVVAYLQYWEEDRSASGAVVNYGTWESMTYTLAHVQELKEIRRGLFPKPLPALKPKLKLKVIPHKSEAAEAWAFPVHITDLSTVKRTQRLFYERHSKRPIQIETYYAVKSLLYFIPLLIGGLFLLLLVKFPLGKRLLLKYPKILSLGYVTRETPINEERLEKSRFSSTLYAEGWKEVLPDANDQYTTPPDTAIVLKVEGRNPGYGATCVCLALAAITVITETEKMPQTGGVYPPGYAFANTSLVKQLKENGVDFNILYEKNL